MSMYTRYAEKPTDFLALTGYTRKEFDKLLPDFRETYYEWMSTHRLDGKPRGNRKYSDYANCPLPTMEAKLFFVLNYLKTNNLQTVQGALFGMSQPKANVWIHCLHAILNLTLDKLGKLPARHMEDVKFAEGEGALYFHDGTERPIERPADSDKQRTYYSGKKRRHTLKNNMLINTICLILFLTPTVEGKRSDKKLADESDYALPSGSRLAQDSGFQGLSVDDVLVLQPKKKPRGGELTDLDKEKNRWISSLRIRVEHAIGSVKRYRIVKDKIRNRKEGFRDAVMATCCGLHNFRLTFRPWNYGHLQLHLFVNI